MGCNFEDFYSFFIRSGLDAITKDLKTLKIIREKAGMNKEEPSIFGQPIKIASNETKELLANNDNKKGQEYKTAYEVLKSKKEEMEKANVINSDTYFHTLAMCEASQLGGIERFNAFNLGIAKEFLDIIRKTFSSKLTFKEILEDSKKDLKNNMTGLKMGISDENCEKRLDHLKPKGLK